MANFLILIDNWMMCPLIAGTSWAVGRLVGSWVPDRLAGAVRWLVPPLLAGLLWPVVYAKDSAWLTVADRLTWVVAVVGVTRLSNALIHRVGDALLSRSRLQGRPMKGVVEILQVVSSGIGVIVVISIVFDKSPLALITGLGAFAAVLMLVFRDTLLGFVAGVMLAKSDMVRIGDRIVMERCGAEGVVVDIDLTTVKVQNMDYTMVTIPPYTLLSESFSNWRPLYDDKVRRVTVEIVIRPSSVRADNLPLFRQYLAGYLHNHPAMLPGRLQMVRLLPLRPEGIPLQVYTFTSHVDYKAFNEVVSQVTEHLLQMAPEFGLQIYEFPAAGFGGFRQNP
jgi:miniconductance mechanosensitive channel